MACHRYICIMQPKLTPFPALNSCQQRLFIAFVHDIHTDVSSPERGLITGLSFQCAQPAGNQEVTPSNLTSRRAKTSLPSINKCKATVCCLLQEILLRDYIFFQRTIFEVSCCACGGVVRRQSVNMLCVFCCLQSEQCTHDQSNDVAVMYAILTVWLS